MKTTAAIVADLLHGYSRGFASKTLTCNDNRSAATIIVGRKKKARNSDGMRAGHRRLAAHAHGQNGHGGQSQHFVCSATAEPSHHGGRSGQQPGGQRGSSQQSVALATGKTGLATVEGEFAMPTPRTDSRTARAKNALHFLMTVLLGQKTGIQTTHIF
jgi:hypothetical protein